MQLRYSPTAPYVCKVAATIIGLGVGDQIERVAPNPWDSEWWAMHWVRLVFDSSMRIGVRVG